MQYFYSGGGNPNPYFSYKVNVKSVTREMYEWCHNYESSGSGDFDRWWIEWGSLISRKNDTIYFENEIPAIMFALKFGVM